MKMQQQEVLFTNDTRSFKRLKGNRILDETNIKQISIQIAQHGQATPVIVNQRKEIIAPIIAKFKNDTQLADMYQNLTPYSAAAKLGSSQAGLKSQQERVNQLTKIGKYYN